ncbi:flagellar hook capping protein FlgD [Clostridium acetobutylicum]|nr:flagellar hook capping protein FlgD [Clostridium acetobutylicum]
MANTTNPLSDLSTVTITENSKTAGGTQIVRNAGNTLGQDAFLKILIAEMSHQDPTSQQDSTQYIAQLAQFSNLEQMTNLNRTMTFSGASSLMGGTVTLKQYDADGVPYRGEVQKVTKNGDAIQIYVKLIDSNGNYVRQEKVDGNGNVVRDSKGNIEYETEKVPQTDSNGNVVKDSNGNIMYKTQDVYKVIAFDYSQVDSVSALKDNIYDTTQKQIDDQVASKSDTSSSSSTTSNTSSST